MRKKNSIDAEKWLKKHLEKPHVRQLHILSFFHIINAGTQLCDYGWQVVRLEKLMYGLMLSYYRTATAFYLSFRSFWFMYKRLYWPGCVKKAEAVVQSVYNKYLDIWVKSKELAVQYYITRSQSNASLTIQTQ